VESLGVSVDKRHKKVDKPVDFLRKNIKKENVF
jgi:hypothetical protein